MLYSVDMNTFLIVLSVLVILMSILMLISLVLIVIVLVMMRRTLTKVQLAVTNVEHTALRSLVPLLGLRNMFSDVQGFVETIKAWTGLAKKTSKKKEKVIDAEE